MNDLASFAGIPGGAAMLAMYAICVSYRGSPDWNTRDYDPFGSVGNPSSREFGHENLA